MRGDHVVGDVPGRRLRADRRLDRGGQLTGELDPVGEDDEEHEPVPAVGEFGAHHQRVGHLGQPADDDCPAR
jgi:hypothetical protein